MKLSNLALRVLVAIFGIPLILSSLYYGGYALLLLVLIITTVSQYEFYKLSVKKNTLPLKTVGLIAGVLITIMFYFQGISALWWILIGGALVISLIELFRNKPHATLNIATTIWGMIYPTTFFSFILLIRELPKHAQIPYAEGGMWLIVFVITIWICDTAAYFIGSAIGRHKLSQRLSPRKTVEGAVAGFIFSFITVYIFYLIYPQLFSLVEYLVIGLLVGVFSQLGDLVESLYKRDVGVKDSSAILPGHGGFLDRFDAPTFMAPIFYFFLKFHLFD